MKIIHGVRILAASAVNVDTVLTCRRSNENVNLSVIMLNMAASFQCYLPILLTTKFKHEIALKEQNKLLHWSLH